MIKVNDLSFAYNNNKVIDIVNAEFRIGEICSILGRNGCGKTTFLKLLARLLLPDSGQITLDGKNMGLIDRKSFAKRISYLPQFLNSPSISVAELVSHGRFPYLSFSRSLTASDKRIIDSAISLAGLEELRNKNLQQLSGGERKRAYIAMLFAQDSDFFLLDEPTAYLDISYKFEVMELLKQMKENQKAVITVMHDIDIALKYSDKIMVIDAGEAVFFGTPDKLLETNIIEKVFGVDCRTIETQGQKEYILKQMVKKRRYIL